MAKKLLTLITLSYNKAPYLKDWAEGLAKQTYLNKMRILVIDDGSTDNSVELLKKYVAEYNLPAEITANGENLGLMYTTKQAYRRINTKYFAVLDADDYYVSPVKVEKAVKFLESHPDYSCYACNSSNVYSDGTVRVTRSEDKPSQTYLQKEGTPFFQTASTTFRNYFSTKLLDAIDKETGNAKRHPFEADSFRNLLAFHFGKLYFENSLDVVWRKNIGAWGAMSTVNQDIENMKSHYLYARFFIEQFGYDPNVDWCLATSFRCYARTVGYLRDFINNLAVVKFNENDSLKKMFENNEKLNFNSIFKDLTEQYKRFSAINLKYAE